MLSLRETPYWAAFVKGPKSRAKEEKCENEISERKFSALIVASYKDRYFYI